MLYKALESMPRKQKFDVQTSQIWMNYEIL
jgi:hypothetical protein